MAEYNKAQLTEMIVGKLLRNFGRTVDEATPNHMFKACAMVLRDIMSGHQIETSNHVWEAQGRQVHYLSLEFLMGRSLEKNAYNLGLLDTLTQVLEDLGFSAADLFETEPDAGLGNGGLGRLAACYLDSMTTLEIPATGYSICYELGIFKQKIIDGKQVELADNWLGLGDAWLIPKMDETEKVHFGGTVKDVWNPDGSHSVTVPVEVDLSNFVMGSNYKTTLYISSREARPGDNAAQVAQYSDKVTLSATYELEWETLYRTTGEGEEIPQLATYHYNGYYSGRDSGLEVEKAVGANIFRLKDWASGVTFKFVLHDDNTCTVPAQSIGYYNSNYNEYVYVADMAVYTGNDSAYASYPCTFDGESTFSFYLIYYVSSGYFAQGTEKLIFDTDIDTTPVVEIAFEGIETTSTGFKAPKLHFSPNEYTKYYKAAVVAGDITADAERQQEVRRQLIDDKLEAVTPVVTLLADDASVWNVPSGNYTAVALAYDSIENPCKLYTQRFTNDPNDEYAPRSLEFEFYAPENNLNYSPYNTLIWQMQTANVAAMKYLCVKTAVADYLCEALGMTLEEVTASRGYDVPEEMIAQLNSPEGRGTSFSPLDEGSTYTLALLMYNSFGDTAFVSKSASTFGYFAKDFDRTKTLEDFIGAFGVTATVDVDSQSSEKTFRMDIARINDRDVLISGMTDMRDFAPQLKGYYDKELHMLIVEPQYAGMYNGAYATLGFSNGLSIFWGDAGMAVGYIGDTLYWASSPYSPEEVNSYMFLLFSTPQASSSKR